MLENHCTESLLWISGRDKPSGRVAKLEHNVEIGSYGIHIDADSVRVLGSNCEADHVCIVIGLNDPRTTPSCAIGGQSSAIALLLIEPLDVFSISVG